MSTLTELDDLLAQLDHAQPFPADVIGKPRGRTTSPRRVALPAGWLDSRTDVRVPAAESDDSGG